MEALIERGSRADAPLSSFSGETPLHIAAGRGDSAMVRLLLDHGADANYLDRNRDAPLHYAMRGDNPDIETGMALLRRGASVEARDRSDETALQVMAAVGNIQMVRLLLEFGADVNVETNATPHTWHEDVDRWPLLDDAHNGRPLYGGVCSGSAEVTDVLLYAGAEINALSFGWSALHAAAAKPDLAMIELLIARGADLYVKSGDGRTPVELLAGFRRSAELLRRAMGC